MRRTTLALLVALTALGLPAASTAALACGPDTAFENDAVRIWFQGFKGHVQVHNKAAGTGASYDLKTLALTETDGGAAVASMNLERAYPHDTGTCTVTQEGDEITITYAVTADVRGAAGGAAAQAGNVVGQATATFIFHFDTADNGAKFDLVVEDWPWQADGTLAFDLGVTAEDATIEPAENGIGFRDAEGTPRGHISWDAEFTTTYADQHEETGTVASQTTSEGDGVRAHLAFTNVTPGYDELFYDPWLGVGPYVVVGPLLIGDSTLPGLLPRL